MVRNLIAAAVAALFVAPAMAQPDPKKSDDTTLVTRVYDLKTIVGERGKAARIEDMDAVIKMILETLPVGDLKPGTDGPQIAERDGGMLEIRATAKLHGEIKNLLDALEGLTDVAVDLRADVIELDPPAFGKLVKLLPKGKPGSPVLTATAEELPEKVLAEVNKLLSGGRGVQKSSARFVNGVEATLSARQAVLTYRSRPGVGWLLFPAKPAGEVSFVKEGFKLVGTPVVSADRRFVRFRLTEQSVAVTGMRTREFGEVDGQKIVAQSPELEDLGATGSAAVDDGGALLFRLAYAPKDKVWVVVLRPTIFIQAEEDAIKEQEKKEKGKK